MSSPNIRRLSRADLYAVFKTEQAVKLVEELINAINDAIPADITVVQASVDAHTADAVDAHQASAIGNTPAGSIAATTVQAAINELDAEKVPATRTVNGHALSADVTVTAGDVGAVPTTRTVNGHALSADVVLSAGDVGAEALGAVAAHVAAANPHTQYLLASGAVAVGSLPSAVTAGVGARNFVTDANATTFNSVVAAGGANKMPVFSDGTNWRIG